MSIHFRNSKKPQTKFRFIYDNKELIIVNYYKYLGFYLHEFMDLNFNANQSSDSASRALAALDAKFKSLKNISCGAYLKVYHSSVASILDFASEIWATVKPNVLIKYKIMYYVSFLEFINFALCQPCKEISVGLGVRRGVLFL